MFRCKQTFKPSGSCTIFVDSDVVLDNGVVEHRKVDASSIVLPPAENYDLQTLLKAGINLQRVNCQLISNNSVTIDLPEEKPDETVTHKEN